MNRTALCLIIILVLCIPAAAGSEGPDISINASRQNITYGDRLIFSGASNGFTLYFFMTGPGLDPAGVMTFNTTKSARTKGHATAIPQGGIWHWGWKTGNVTGPLPDGNYTIYACIGPFDTEQLATCDRCKCVTTNVTLTGSPGSRIAGAAPPAQETLVSTPAQPIQPVSPLPVNGSGPAARASPALPFCLPASVAATAAGLFLTRRNG
jgi:hypothetical protein